MDDDINTFRADWSQPTDIRFGLGRVVELPKVCAELGMKAPLLVTDPGLASHAIVHRVAEAFRGRGLRLEVFHGVRPNPEVVHAAGVRDAFRQGSHDGLIAFGGGTALESCKVGALMVAASGSLWAFEADAGDAPHGGGPDSLPPLIAVPTTAGSGAEARPCAIITDASGDQPRRRRLLSHRGMLPRAIIADPELTIGLPPQLTAATGMNALTHALEAYCAHRFDPAADGMAAEAVRLIRMALPGAVRNANDLVSRSRMMAAALMGGIVFRKGLGGIQALAAPVASLTGAHYGLVTAVLAPYVLAYNRPAVADRLGPLAAYTGLGTADAEGLQGGLLALRRELGITETLAGLGMSRDCMPTLAEEAAVDPFAAANPRPLDATVAGRIYARAFDGDLSNTD